MTSLITIGRNNFSVYIFLIAFFKLWKDIFFVGVNYRNSFIQLKLPPTNTQQYLSKHIFIHKLICYLFTFFVYSIKNCCETSDKLKKTSIFKVLFIIFLWVVEETLNEIFKGILDLEFWMFGLIFISFMSKGKNEKHHKFSNYFILIFCSIFKLILIFIDASEDDRNDIINKDLPWYFIVLGFFIYMVIIFIRAYVYINLKSFMDENFMSSSEILMHYGLIGTIISLIVCLISTFEECSSGFLSEHICPVPYINGEDYIYNSKKKYFDNFILYYKTLQGEINNEFANKDLGLEIFCEILVIIIGTIFFLVYKYYFMEVINKLSPGHAIFSYSINKIIPKIILPIFTLFIKGKFFLKEKENTLCKYILGLINNFLAAIGFAIYLEIIILHFCGLDHDIEDEINKRGNKDKNISLVINDDNDDNESEVGEEIMMNLSQNN